MSDEEYRLAVKFAKEAAAFLDEHKREGRGEPFGSIAFAGAKDGRSVRVDVCFRREGERVNFWKNKVNDLKYKIEQKRSFIESLSEELRQARWQVQNERKKAKTLREKANGK